VPASRWLVAVALGGLLLAHAVHAVPIAIVYGDAAGEGFFDPILGSARRSAFEFAVHQWETTLAGNVPITIAATMEALGGSGDSALLASTTTTTLHRNFGGAAPNVWYGAALANELSGHDVNGADTPEITIMFNADVDEPAVLGSIAWYYGTDAQPGTDVDFVTIALHELGHGLNFFDAVDAPSGGWQTPSNQPGIFDQMLFRAPVGRFTDMLAAERLAAIISPPLLWTGPNATLFNGASPAVFTPDPFEPGSSLSHWDPALAPGELMGPSYTGANHDPGLLLPALADMGWQLAQASPTPRASAATATATPTATPTATSEPVGTPRRRKDFVYVANFDDATVSVVDPFNRRVTSTIPVPDGPVGVAASADGRRVYVASFRTGRLATLSTRAGRTLTTIPVGQSANGVAVTPDGAMVVVTDTAADEVAILDTATERVVARAAAGLQPSSLAMSRDGHLAFVADYGEARVAVIDVAAGVRRAILSMNQSNVTGIAVASGADAGFAASFFGSLVKIDTAALTATDFPATAQARSEAVAMAADGTVAYVAGYAADGSQDQVAIIDVSSLQIVANIPTGNLPVALALSSDGSIVYVANAGSNSVSFVNPQVHANVGTVPVGAAPMGIAVAAVPQFCDGDCNGNGGVSIGEIVLAVAIALGEQPAPVCIAADRDDDGTITIAEVIGALHNALVGCPAPPIG
jgi:YVTN family beta-propeller protein